MKKTDKELEARDAKRDIGSELLDSVKEMMADKRSREHNVEATELAIARQKVGLSQAEFATLLGVSKRTLQDWEQGRREPSGAAKSLIEIAMKRPDVLVEVLGKYEQCHQHAQNTSPNGSSRGCHSNTEL